MERTKTEGFPPPPGIINSLKAGFDAIAAHIYTIFLPLLLNLFFWLGPRLRMNAFFDSIKVDLTAFWKLLGASPADIQMRLGELEMIIPNFNLFWTLRTFPIGIFGLKAMPFTFSGIMVQKTDILSPLGIPVELQVNSTNLIVWYVLLTIIGWIGGGIYFHLVARATFSDNVEINTNLLRALTQTIMLSITWNILALFVGLPARLILEFIIRTTGFLGVVIFFGLSLASMWVIVPLFFWPQGIFVGKQNFITSALTSLQLTRFTLPTSSMFVLSVFLLSFGLNYLWNISPEDSWMTLFGIFGHAFVTTGLLAASFIYYRDMNIWLQKVIEHVRAGTPRQML
jgi:hypothetical protein